MYPLDGLGAGQQQRHAIHYSDLKHHEMLLAPGQTQTQMQRLQLDALQRTLPRADLQVGASTRAASLPPGSRSAKAEAAFGTCELSGAGAAFSCSSKGMFVSPRPNVATGPGGFGVSALNPGLTTPGAFVMPASQSFCHGFGSREDAVSSALSQQLFQLQLQRQALYQQQAALQSRRDASLGCSIAPAYSNFGGSLTQPVGTLPSHGLHDHSFLTSAGGPSALPCSPTLQPQWGGGFAPSGMQLQTPLPTQIPLCSQRLVSSMRTNSAAFPYEQTGSLTPQVRICLSVP